MHALTHICTNFVHTTPYVTFLTGNTQYRPDLPHVTCDLRIFTFSDNLGSTHVQRSKWFSKFLSTWSFLVLFAFCVCACFCCVKFLSLSLIWCQNLKACQIMKQLVTFSLLNCAFVRVTTTLSLKRSYHFVSCIPTVVSEINS